jgi:hypothetical protein
MGPDAPFPEQMKDYLHYFSTPCQVVDIKQEPEAMYLHLLFALQDPKLVVMHANFAHTMFYAFKMLEWEQKNLINDLANQSIACKLDIRMDFRECLQGLMNCSSVRAKCVKEAFKEGMEGLAARLWPDLDVAITVDTGPAFQIYGDHLRNTFLKGVNVYSPYYFATEGLMGVNVHPKCVPTQYVLNPRAMFFELIPYELIYEDQPDTVRLHQV